ncbi:MAG TPA: NADH-quinone oxidoreductase subunit NuoE [Hydrogenispora sp.]|jgi:NADH:ubiquinone oxidoreductase subunit E|nr:NADH-quinone oxidoreductase subunit NuoE [Hydrogenispora sp.]
MTETCCRSFSEEQYRDLDKVIAQYQGKPGGLIPVLHQAQLIFGYLPKEIQIRVAEGLNVPLSEVYGVVTFYSFFSQQPRGKHTIGVCLGTACYVKGAADIVEALEEELEIKVGETTANGDFTLMVTRCVGACGLAPVLTVGEDVYGRLTADKIPEVLKHYQKTEA